MRNVKNTELLGIGGRAREEAKRLSKADGMGAKEWLADHWMVGHDYSNWLSSAPSALNLRRLHYAGADVMYILTGERGSHENRDQDIQGD